MFTPQRKGWPRWSLTPGKTDAGNNDAAASAKGKAVMECPPPRASLEENGGVGTPGMFSSPGEAEVWKRFRESGALDPESLEKKEREALADRVSKLEAEVCFEKFFGVAFLVNLLVGSLVQLLHGCNCFQCTSLGYTEGIRSIGRHILAVS